MLAVLILTFLAFLLFIVAVVTGIKLALWTMFALLATAIVLFIRLLWHERGGGGDEVDQPGRGVGKHYDTSK